MAKLLSTRPSVQLDIHREVLKPRIPCLSPNQPPSLPFTQLTQPPSRLPSSIALPHSGNMHLLPSISLSSRKPRGITTSAGLPHSHPVNDTVAVRVTRTVEGETDASNTPTSVRLPPVAHVSPSVRSQNDMMIDFFGGRRTHQSRSSSQSNPPPYSPRDDDVDALPAYPGRPDEEPATLARYMFLYGFVFPLFWIVGTFILFSPLRVTPEWELGKSPEERDFLLNRMRSTEIKWARRCLLATLTVLMVVAAIILTVVFVTHRK